MGFQMVLPKITTTRLHRTKGPMNTCQKGKLQKKRVDPGTTVDGSEIPNNHLGWC